MTGRWGVALPAFPAVLSFMICQGGTAFGTPKRVEASLDRSNWRIVFAQVPFGGDEDGKESCADRAGPGDLIPGSRIVVLDLAASSRAVTNMTAEFAAAGRPEISFDGRRILFVGRKRPDDRLDVWEMPIEGGKLRRVTDGSLDCLQAAYLSTIYTMAADKPEEFIAITGRTPGLSAAALFICHLDGSGLERITFSPFDTTDPLLISDGRLLFSQWSPVGGLDCNDAKREEASVSSNSLQRTALYTVYPDGADLFPFAAVHESPARRTMPCETPDGSIIYVESSGTDKDPGGSLVSVSRTRSLRSRRVVADDSEGTYHSPSRLSDGKVLVSFRRAKDESYGIFSLDVRTGQRRELIYDDARWHDVHAHLVRARKTPAGRSSVVDAAADHGELYCLDAYISDRAPTRGPQAGRIERLRIIQALMAGTGRETMPVSKRTEGEGVNPMTGIGEIVLGEVPVEEDGSFFLEVPARTPMRLETLDSDGSILRGMKSWFWVMPGERRGCIGCHEDREMTPPNRHVRALRKAPQRIGAAAMEVRRKPEP